MGDARPPLYSLDSMSIEPMIFVLEDDPGITAVVRHVCKAAGLPARMFNAAADFLAEPSIPAGSLILLDLALGDANGVDILRLLAAYRCPAPIYLMSGQDDRLLANVQKLGLSYGLDVRGILQKPFDVAELTAILTAPREATRAPRAKVTSTEELHRAVMSGELCLHYQPKLDIGTGALIGCEALVRWFHPARGLVPPGEFLPAAEEAGLMGAITQWVLNEALGQVAAWREEGLHLGVSVNMPADMLNELALPGVIQSLLKTHTIEGRRLTLEVTEAAAMKSLLTAVDVLARLRLMGISLSIDDFGTGHSSIVKLRQLPFNELKIDRSFVQDLSRDRDARLLVSAMITMGHSFGMKTVGEGVERAADLACLATLGCGAAQGYYFSRPLPPAEFAAWVRALGV